MLIFKLDVHNAFLHKDLDKEVYISLPKSIIHSYPNQMCKNLESIHSLKQSSRQWFENTYIVLLSTSFKQCPTDHSFFIDQKHDSFIALLIYVGNLILSCNNLDIINKVKKTLLHHFHIKDLAALKYFLGLEVTRHSSGINLCQ